MHGIYPEITKDYILLKLSEEDIMEKYTRVPVNNETLKANSFSNPYREDKNPSCNYWYSDKGKLRFRDWTEDRNYDCFDAVAKDKNLKSSNKQDFINILHTIAKDFRINKYEKLENVKHFDNHAFKPKVYKKKRKRNFIFYKVKLRKFNYHDNSYFGSMGLEQKDLRGFYLIQEIYQSIAGKPFKCVYRYNPKDLCIGYYGMKDKVYNYDLWKFYFPFRNKKDDIRGSKFITNGVFVQGIQYLVPSRICVITKAYKDSAIFRKIGLQSCAVSAESIIPSKKDMNFLNDNFDYLVSCMDFDLTGIKMANKLKKRYNVAPFMFTNGRFNQKDYEAKDASEYTTNNSIDQFKNIVLDIYSNYKELILEKEKEMFNNLKFTQW